MNVASECGLYNNRAPFEEKNIVKMSNRIKYREHNTGTEDNITIVQELNLHLMD